MVLLSKKSIGEVYNIGSSKSIKIKKVVQIIKSIIKKGIPIYGSFKLRKNENIKLISNINKIKREIGWKPKVSLHEGLEKTIKYLKNT